MNFSLTISYSLPLLLQPITGKRNHYKIKYKCEVVKWTTNCTITIFNKWESHYGKDILFQHFFEWYLVYNRASHICGSEVKTSACSAGDLGSIPGLGRSPGEGNGSHSSILSWRIPWREESPRGRKGSDTTELLHFHFSIQ